MVNKKY